MPHRIQQRRTKGWKKPPNTVIVSRSSRWGNPFPIKELGRDEAIRRYDDMVARDPEFMAKIKRELRGKHLAC